MNFNEILFRNIGPNAVWQNLSSKFGCPVLFGQETHMPSPVKPYQILADQLTLFKPVGVGGEGKLCPPDFYTVLRPLVVWLAWLGENGRH